MKIGIFSPYLDTLTGGEKYILTAAQCLAKNHSVSIFWDKDAQELKQNAKRKFNLSLDSIQFTKNIFDKKISLVARLLESKKYDKIVYLSDGSIPLVLSKLILHFQFPVEWIQGKSLKTKLKFLTIDSIICNSEFTKSYIDKTFGIQSIVLYPPCETEIDSKKKENIILNVGRFGQNLEGSYYKKQDVLIDAFKILVKNGLKNWKLVFIVSVRDEDQEKLKNLKQKAEGLPIEFIENAEKSEVARFNSVSKIYWHASGFGENLTANPEKAEHFGIATVEAMAGGSVPIVINAGGQKEIVTDGENGFLWNTTQELCAKTIAVIKNEKLWDTISQNAKKRAEDFSEKLFCLNLLKIIEKNE